MRAISIATIFLVAFIAAPAFADFGGTINFSNSGNRSTVTGIWAYTVNLCNSTSACMPQGAGLSCFTDYDNVSETSLTGWCNATSLTNCYHNNTAYASGTNICVTNITTRSCSSGVWQGISNCSSGQTCPSAFGTPGNCTSSSSSSSSSSSGGTTSTNTTNKASSIIFTSVPLSFEMIQGNSAERVVVVKNNGNATLYNITMTSSLSWSSVLPAKWSQSAKNNETAFTVSFSAPADAEVKAHVVTLEAKTHNASVKASKSFNITVKPSNQTVQERIFPEYNQYSSMLTELELNISLLKMSGANVEEAESLLLNARSKLSQANESLESKDYYTAQQLLDDAKGLLDAASSQAKLIQLPSSTAAPADFTFMIIIAVIAGVIVLAVYLVLPPRKSKPTTFFEKSSEKKTLKKKK